MAIVCRDIKLLFVMVPGTGCTAVGQVLKDRFGGRYLPEKSLAEGNVQLLDKKHNTVKQLVQFNVISQDELNSYLTFATIRNPFDILATEYQRLIGGWTELHMDENNPKSWINHYKGDREVFKQHHLRDVQLAREKGFEYWIAMNIGLKRSRMKVLKDLVKAFLKKKVSHYPHNSKLHIFSMLEDVDEVIRYENLESDFNDVLRKVGINEYVPIPFNNKTPGKKSYHQYYTPQSRAILEKFLAKELEQFEYSF